MKFYHKLFSVLVLIGVICLSAGCKKSGQKFKVPEIKMITSENVHGVIAADDDHIWITGKYGIIYHSSDGGETWEQQDSGIKEGIIVDGSFLDNKTGWVVGLNGTVLFTYNGGEIWTRQETGTKRHLFSICFVDRLNGWAIGEWNTVIHSSDGGKTWQRQTKENDKILNNVFFVDRDKGWIVGERGLIRHTSDGGKTWIEQKPKAFVRNSFEEEIRNPAPALFCVVFTDQNRGFVCGIDGTIGRTENGGESWDILDSPTDLTLYTVFIKDKMGWIVGDKGAYLFSSDNGKTWELKEGVIKTRFKLRDVFFSSPQKGWIVGAIGTVVHTEDGGMTWAFRSGLSYAMEFLKMPKVLEFGGGTE